VFDLDAELDSLKQEASWQHGDRNARTLVQGPGLRLVLTTAKAGARIREHRTSAWVSIEAIDGHLQIHMPEQVMDLPRGHVLVLEPEMPHDVEALKESAFLLTIASTTENKAAT
jgi:quercetin dioxygenase-like cupin family protein